MPHARKRFISEIFIKRIKHAPAVLLNGARQTGKSFFIRDLVSKTLKNLHYVTLDNKQKRELAIENPWSMIGLSDEKTILAIDEAQRAPDLFEAVKEKVDLNRRPSQFVLLGSTEFSHRSNIRESLTGRASRLQMFPLLISEVKALELAKDNLNRLDASTRVTRKDLMQYLDRGGLPGIFAIRDDYDRTNQFEDWIDLTARRDIFQIGGFKPDSALARRILEFVARNSENSIGVVAKALSVDRRKITKHIEALKALFVIESLDVFPGSAGEEIYFLCDVGLANYLGASFDQRLRTWIALELRAQAVYRGELQNKYCTYLTSHGSRIDFVLEKNDQVIAIKVLPYEHFSYQDLQILRAFKNKRPKTICIGLASRGDSQSEKGIAVLPWEVIA